MTIQIIMPMDELYLELEKIGWKNEFDEKAFEDKWKWIGKKPYVRIRDKGYIKSEHRVIWEKHNGPIPKDMIIHHINGDTEDNRIENLQLVTFVEHMKMHRRRK